MARQQLEALNWEPNPERMADWGRDFALLPLDVAALTGPASVPIQQAHHAEDLHHWPAAREAYLEAEKMAGNDPRTLAYIPQKLPAIGFIEKLFQGQSAALPIDNALSGWQRWSGDWKVVPNGLQVNPTNGVHDFYFQGATGNEFEMEGDLIFSGPGPHSGGVIFGLCERCGPRWYAVTLHQPVTGAGECVFTTKYLDGARRMPAKVEDHNHIRLRLSGRKLSVRINQQATFLEVEPLQYARGLFAGTTVGFGARLSQSSEPIQYLNWKVRTLGANERSQVQPKANPRKPR